MTYARCRHAALLIVLLSLAACTATPARPADSEVISVVESFYAAMKSGDVAAAMRPMAPDAVFLESGGLETRAEYETNHLPADIKFESQVTGKRGPWQVTFQGDDTAWLHAITDYEGTFDGSPVSFLSAQLVVMTRGDAGWQIRTIHWSSRRRVVPPPV